MNLVFKNCTSSETLENLKNGKGDVGLVNLPIDDAVVTLSSKVMGITDVFVASEKFSDLKGKKVSLKDLQNYPLLMLETSTVTRQSLEGFAKMQGVTLNPEIELASLELATKLAVNGMGIACVPKEFVIEELSSGALFEVEVEPALPPRAIGLVLPKNGAQSFAAREFIKILAGEK